MRIATAAPLPPRVRRRLTTRIGRKASRTTGVILMGRRAVAAKMVKTVSSFSRRAPLGSVVVRMAQRRQGSVDSGTTPSAMGPTPTCAASPKAAAVQNSCWRRSDRRSARGGACGGRTCGVCGQVYVVFRCTFQLASSMGGCSVLHPNASAPTMLPCVDSSM